MLSLRRTFSFLSIIPEGWGEKMGMNGVERKELGNKRVLESTEECLNAKISLEGEVGRRKVGTYLCGNELNTKGL